MHPDPDPVCPERLDPDPDPINIRLDPKVLSDFLAPELKTEKGQVKDRFAKVLETDGKRIDKGQKKVE